MVAPVRQCVKHIHETAQTLVDVFGLSLSLARRPCLLQTLGPGQVDKLQLSSQFRVVIHILGLDQHLRDQMRP